MASCCATPGTSSDKKGSLTNMQERTKMADICYNAWKMCMICRDQDQQMECHSSCMETTMTLQNCMTMIMLNNPHAIDMIKVSVAMADTCGDICSKMTASHCKECSQAMKDYSSQMKQLIKQ